MTSRKSILELYLLGELSDAERLGLEREYFNNVQTFDQLVEAENELTDKYARGQLSPETRVRFENYYLAHAELRERVKFSQALAAKVDQRNEIPERSVQTESSLNRWLALLRVSKLGWAFSIILLLMAAGATWSLIKVRHLQQDLVRVESERAAQAQHERDLQQQVTSERQRAEQLSAELDRMRAEHAISLPSPSPSASESSPSFVTLALTVSGIRGSESGPPALLVIPARTEQVRIQLTLRENDYLSYSAALQPAGGKEMFVWPQLTPKITKSGTSFGLIISAQRFASGDYILTLRGISRTGEAQDVSKSLFRVERN
jgi:hypothetical protein